jgi:hypothetical protein
MVAWIAASTSCVITTPSFCSRHCENGTLQEKWNSQLQGQIYFKVNLVSPQQAEPLAAGR